MTNGTTLVAGVDHRYADRERPVRQRRRGGGGAWMWIAPFRARLVRRARQARADADRPQGRPAGVARGLGAARGEPPPHLVVVRLVSGPPGDAPAHARLRCGEPRRPRAARAHGKWLVIGLESGLVGAAWRRRARAPEHGVRSQPLHDDQPVLDLFEGAAGGRGAWPDSGDRRADAPVRRRRPRVVAGAARRVAGWRDSRPARPRRLRGRDRLGRTARSRRPRSARPSAGGAASDPRPDSQSPCKGARRAAWRVMPASRSSRPCPGRATPSRRDRDCETMREGHNSCGFSRCCSRTSAAARSGRS